MLEDIQEVSLLNQFLLPHIPEGKRIVINDLIRSSLFTVSNHNCKREYLKEKTLYSFYSTEIIFTGEELRQDDEDVWLQLIYSASDAQSDKIHFKPYSFLSQIGWPSRTQYRDRLKDSLTRMSATNLKIYNRDYQQGIGLSLVRRFEWFEGDRKLNEWQVWLEPEIVKLFSALGRVYTKIQWDQRKQLKPLAKWLHAFYSSHAEPAPILLSKLKELSGSKTKSFRHFKENIREALFELVQIGFCTTFFIDAKNQLHFSRDKDGKLGVL